MREKNICPNFASAQISNFQHSSGQSVIPGPPHGRVQVPCHGHSDGHCKPVILSLNSLDTMTGKVDCSGSAYFVLGTGPSEPSSKLPVDWEILVLRPGLD